MGQLVIINEIKNNLPFVVLEYLNFVDVPRNNPNKDLLLIVTGLVLWVRR